VLEHPGGVVRQQSGDTVALDPFGSYYPLVLQQPAGGERLEVLQAVRGERAIDASARVEDPALRVAE